MKTLTLKTFEGKTKTFDVVAAWHDREAVYCLTVKPEDSCVGVIYVAQLNGVTLTFPDIDHNRNALDLKLIFENSAVQATRERKSLKALPEIHPAKTPQKKA